MDVQADGAAWPPSMGDYVRVRNGGVLGEVIDVAFTRATCRYTVNVFSSSMAEPLSFRLEDLESVWRAWPSAFGARRREKESSTGWRTISKPS
jgi:hypothetical protein